MKLKISSEMLSVKIESKWVLTDEEVQEYAKLFMQLIEYQPDEIEEMIDIYNEARSSAKFMVENMVTYQPEKEQQHDAAETNGRLGVGV